VNNLMHRDLLIQHDKNMDNKVNSKYMHKTITS